MELNPQRMYRPWGQASRLEKIFVILALGGVLFAWYGDVVYWFENGHGYFDVGFPWSGREAASQPLATLDSLSALVGGVIALQTVRSSWTLRFFALGYFALLGGLLAYSGLQAPHPVSIVPAALLLVGTLTGAIAYLRSPADPPAEVDRDR